MRTFGFLALTALALTACGSPDPAEQKPAAPTTVVARVAVEGDTDEEIRQFTFVDGDGVEQKCFLFGAARGSVSCQPVTK